MPADSDTGVNRRAQSSKDEATNSRRESHRDSTTESIAPAVTSDANARKSSLQPPDPLANRRKSSLLSAKNGVTTGGSGLSSRRTSVSPGRSDKHVRLTLPDITISPVPGGPRLSLMGSLLSGNSHSSYPGYSVQGSRYRRRRAVSTADYKTCALVQSKMKLGDLM